LLLRIVTECLPGFHHAAGQRRFGDDHPGPDGVLQFLLADCALVAFQEEDDEFLDFRFDQHRLAVAQDFATASDEGVVQKPVDRVGQTGLDI
jgi:hypothetical protein